MSSELLYRHPDGMKHMSTPMLSHCSQQFDHLAFFHRFIELALTCEIVKFRRIKNLNLLFYIVTNPLIKMFSYIDGRPVKKGRNHR